MHEITEPSPQPARYDAVVRFREDPSVVERARDRAHTQGTQLASVLRGLLREWLARKDDSDIWYI